MLKKILIHLKNNQIYYLTFITGLIIIGIIYSLQKIAPFGRNSMLTIDFFHQYGPMLGELYDRVKNGFDLIYSFSMGMGLPFIRNFMNYLSSPFNIIIFFFKRENIVMAFSLIIGLKAVSASVTMVYYLSKKFNKKSMYLIPLGILYGFCAYFTAYYWNIMWLDGLVMLPLIIYGIEKLVVEEKCAFYIISLALMLAANYFIGFMICIFSVLYFLAYLILKTNKIKIKEILRKGILFGGSSLLAGGLVAILLLPLSLSLNSISATSDLWPTSQYYAFTIWEYLANHFSGIMPTVLSSDVASAANISCGILSITLVLLFIVNPEIKIKTKLVYGSLLLLIIISFFWAPLDFIWHGFHVPNDLPYRYSFIYSFILIIISAYALVNIRKLSIKMVSLMQLITLIFIGILLYFKPETIDDKMILLNFVLIMIYFALYLLDNHYPMIRKFIPYVFILAVILECSVAINHNWHILQYIDEFYEDYPRTREALDYINKHDDSFYRVERTSILTFNDPSWYNYYGQTTFSSMAYENLAVLQNFLGLPGNNINSYYYKQTTPIYDLMFNIKYFFGETYDSERYSLFYQQGINTVFKNNHTAGLMFSVNKEIQDWQSISDNPFYIQNDFIERTTGVKNVLNRMNHQEKEIIYDKDGKMVVKYTFNNPNENMYYYIRDQDADFMVVGDVLYYLNDDFYYFNSDDENIRVMDYIDYHEYHVVNRVSNEPTYTIYVGYNNYRYDAYYAYSLDGEKFETAANELLNNTVNITDFKEHYIKGNITTPTDKIIYTSIPYDEGWQVLVDGNPVKMHKIGNALLGFDINPGKHEIVLSYFPKGMKLGSLISGISLITIIFVYCYKKKLLKK